MCYLCCLTLSGHAGIPWMVGMLCKPLVLLWVLEDWCALWPPKTFKCLALCDHPCELSSLLSCWVWGDRKGTHTHMYTQSASIMPMRPTPWGQLSLWYSCCACFAYIRFRAKPAASLAIKVESGKWHSRSIWQHMAQENKAHLNGCSRVAHNQIYQSTHGTKAICRKAGPHLDWIQCCSYIFYGLCWSQVTLLHKSPGILEDGAAMKLMLKLPGEIWWLEACQPRMGRWWCCLVWA